jgi:hypothetical protein
MLSYVQTIRLAPHPGWEQFTFQHFGSRKLHGRYMPANNSYPVLYVKQLLSHSYRTKCVNKWTLVNLYFSHKTYSYTLISNHLS